MNTQAPAALLVRCPLGGGVPSLGRGQPAPPLDRAGSDHSGVKRRAFPRWLFQQRQGSSRSEPTELPGFRVSSPIAGCVSPMLPNGFKTSGTAEQPQGGEEDTSKPLNARSVFPSMRSGSPGHQSPDRGDLLQGSRGGRDFACSPLN